MFLPLALAAGLVLCGLGTTPVMAQDSSYLTLPRISDPIVPTASLRGDREFGGNGPDLTVQVELRVGQRGRAIYADVTFWAEETGGDESATSVTEHFQVWRWRPGDRLVQSIDAPVFRHTVRSNETCGMCAGAVDGAFPTVMRGGPYGIIDTVRMIGDTMGDDISTDQDPHGDTAIHSISFRPVLVTWSDRIGS